MDLQVIQHRELKTQADAITYFLQRLDIEMVSDILEDNRTYQDFEKSVFVVKLGVALDEFIAAGDTFLNCYSGSCNEETCNFKCTGFSFIGNHSQKFFDLIIDIKGGVVHDIYECSKFKNLLVTSPKDDRVIIDRFAPPL